MKNGEEQREARSLDTEARGSCEEPDITMRAKWGYEPLKMSRNVLGPECQLRMGDLSHLWGFPKKQVHPKEERKVA